MKHLRLLASLVFALATTALAQNTTPPPAASTEAAPAEPADPAKAWFERLEKSGIKLVHGPSEVKLGNVAAIKIPEKHVFIDASGLDKFFEITHNFRSGKEVGVILAPTGWVLFFDYDAVGYVKDEEKNDLNAEKMYKSMLDNQDAGNEHRRSKGWAEHKLQGWATPPHYDEKTNNLNWAFKFSTSADQFKQVNINSNTRLLGRGGIMEVTLATEDEYFKAHEIESNELLKSFNYVDGQKYAEFKKGDKIAEYGLAALVVGGAGAVAYKTGLLGKLGILLAKGGKLVWAGLIAIVVGIAKLWKKITGRGEPPKSPWRQE